MVSLRAAVLILGVLLLASCSTLKGWFTPQGQKLSQAQTFAAQGHPLAASALALEALGIEPEYKEAKALLAEAFSAGQKEFSSSESQWRASASADRWDRLYELYRWQETLAQNGVAVNPNYAVESVAGKLQESARSASEYHLMNARGLLAAAAGPRQARKALTEGRVAARYDGDTPGLQEWLSQASEAATQKLLVIPFFYDAGFRAIAVSAPLASRVSQKLIDGALPELTTIFPSDRLVTLPGGGLARIGLVSQPDALRLAADASQNLVLMGQLTQVSVQEPRSRVRAEAREKKTLFIDPEHPQGVEKTYKAIVTTTVWSTRVSLSASFTVIEVPTKHDLTTAVRSAEASDETTFTTFVGDEEALTSDDLTAIAKRVPLETTDGLWIQAVDRLADQIASSVREGLR